MGNHKNENGIKRCVVSIDGITGYLVAVVGLVATLLFLGVWAVNVQNANSEVYYSLNQDIHAIKTQSIDNNTFRIIEK